MKKIMKQNHQSTPVKEDLSRNAFPIVVIGASAGGLNALIDFFKPIPPQCNMAFVVISHLNPLYKSMMPELIHSHTQLPVIAIQSECKIEPNHIYIVLPNKNIMIKNDAFVFLNQHEPHYPNLPIDCLFHFVAIACKTNAVAVVLSGCGSDGSLGLCEIKRQGGIVVVQTPKSALYDSMPINAINTGMVDIVGTPEKMYIEINALLKNNAQSKINHSFIPQPIFDLLKERTGNDFSGYKAGVMKRRIDRQLKRLELNKMDDFAAYLHKNKDEIDFLFQELLIGVTSFFRDPGAFNELKQSIIPSILKNKFNNSTFRGWIPGCSTGQEAYSMAIVLREYMEETNHYFHVQLFCTDIDRDALNFARSGLYPSKIALEISPERLTAYFIKEKSGYRIIKDIREMIVFGIQNILQDPPFTKQDIISCRNLLIYLNSASQHIIFPLLHFGLNPNGILFLGESESACQYRHLFKPCYGNTYKFFDKINGTQSIYKNFKTITKINELGSNRPLVGQSSSLNLALVHLKKTLNTKRPSMKKNCVNNQSLLDLENELRLTKETLQSTIEELETSNEEMQSTNEEIQSINEELETSKEELQSVNEELLIVNAELQNRIEETSAINEDMNALFNNAHIAAIFLDNTLNIKQFTLKIQGLINLIPGDVGRSLRHFSNNIKSIDLIQMAERVLIAHESKTLDVQDVNGRWYFMSISPYRSPNNKEDGVVIMFMEITQNKLNEEKVLQLNQALNDSTVLLSGMLSVLQECVVILDCNMTIHSSNDLFCKKFLLQSDEIIGHSFYEVGNNQWDIPALRTLLNGVLTDDLVVNGYALEHTFLRAGYKQLILNVRKTTLREGESFIFIAIEER